MRERLVEPEPDNVQVRTANDGLSSGSVEWKGAQEHLEVKDQPDVLVIISCALRGNCFS